MLTFLRQIAVAVLLTGLLFGCARAPLQNPEEALRETPAKISLKERLPKGELAQALLQQIDYLQKNRRVAEFRFGERRVSREDYLLALGALAEELTREPDDASLSAWLLSNFHLYEVYGRSDWGEVFITSYFEPVIEGRKRSEGRFNHPVYRVPEDLVEVKLRAFGGGAKDPKVLRGRFISTANESVPAVVPYYSREEIDSANKLRGKGLELCWVDPIDSFFMQIQGSGVIRFPSGEELRVGYAGQNGHAYEAIGKYLREALAPGEITLQRIEQHLRTIEAPERDRILNKNPSYVFFKKSPQNAVTYLGVPATASRTIATDAKYFPKGALAVLSFQVPLFESASQDSPTSWVETTQLVLDQDVGGAIRGPDRVDFFWGRGDPAKRAAGVIQQKGNLVYLAPKSEWLATLRARN